MARRVNQNKYSEYYILKGRRAYRCSGEEWSQNYSSLDNRTIAITEFANEWVSTVFLGINHDYTGKGPPKIFETMVFPSGSYTEEYCRRYSTWGEAEEGYWLAVWKNLDTGELS